MTQVKFHQKESGPSLRIEERPDGPVVEIDQNGGITLHRTPPDEAGRLFWEAVNFNGITYREIIEQLNQKIDTLMLDPFRSIVHGPVENVWQAIPKAARGKMVRADVHAVLDAINQLAIKEIQ